MSWIPITRETPHFDQTKIINFPVPALDWPQEQPEENLETKIREIVKQELVNQEERGKLIPLMGEYEKLTREFDWRLRR